MKYLIFLILIFFFYSFFGWLMEVSISLFQRHKFINRGFLIGPLCPVYGCGCVLVTILLERYTKDPLVLFLMSIIICSVLEYTTSYLMEKIFKNRWWDYSDKTFNINGRICLECAVPFGIGSTFIFYVTNPLIYKLLDLVNLNILKITCLVLIFIFVIDLCISFNVIINLKNISNSVRCDSTEAITKKVKEILLKKNILYIRLVDSFPKMQIKNKLSILADKIKNDKFKLKYEKKQIKNKKRK